MTESNVPKEDRSISPEDESVIMLAAEYGTYQEADEAEYAFTIPKLLEFVERCIALKGAQS